ncbi:MAG: alanine racemase [Desulfobacteraceae bacterium]|nr:MAG: alanine racemase [Desulfobacteraceae bacterium]
MNLDRVEPYVTWAEIDLKAIVHNLRSLKSITRAPARMMAVVKANAYGHGYKEVSRAALEGGADMLGVARIDEAVRLRQAGLDAPILIFGYTPPDHANLLIRHHLTQTVGSYEMAAALSEAIAGGESIRIHLKVDTGMGRLGILPDCRRFAPLGPSRFASAVDEVKAIAGLPGFELEGVYTHFASADSSNKTEAERQFEIFQEFLHDLTRAGIEFPVRHAANSAAIIDMPETHLDMVRAGISLYGLYPSEEVDKNRVSLRPAMALKTRIAHLKRVPAGFKVSYGLTYETNAPTTIATVPIGYADGFDRLLSSRGHMLVCGKRAPIIGRICMDQTMLEVGHIPEAGLDEEVVAFGSQRGHSIPAEEVASTIGTINYEVVSKITERVFRRYLK